MKLLVFLVAILFLDEAPAHDHPSVHGMLVVGTEKVYLSHLPMFHAPHDYQAILEVSLPVSAKHVYFESKAAHAEKVYTLVPEAFVLPEMIKSPRPFKAKLYRGHFERGGTPLTGEVMVTIKQVVYFKKLNPATPRPVAMEFVSFGSGDEWFMAHVITNRPNFDQIVQVDDSVNPGVITLGTANAHRPLLPSHHYVTANGELLLIKEEVYVEFGDLRH